MMKWVAVLNKLPYLGLAFALLSVPAHAGIVYATGFESSDGYTLGPLAGQNGWLEFNSALSSVENFFVESGSQAVFVNGNTSNLQAGPYHVDAPTGPMIDLQADLYIASGVENTWQFAATGPGLSQFLGGFNLIPENPVAGTVDDVQLISGALPTVGTFDLNTWNHVDVLFDMTSQTFWLTLNGNLLANDVAFCGSNSGCNGAFVANYADSFFDVFGNLNSTDSATMDNFSLSQFVAAPEPGSLLLIGTGLIFLARRKSARK